MTRRRPAWQYRWLRSVLAPAIALYTVSRAVKDGGWRYLRERYGLGYRHTGDNRDESLPLLWIHAASVGEVQTVSPLVDAALNGQARQRVLLTTTTPTGAAMVARQFDERVAHAYLPIDFAGATARFLRHWRPQRAWFVETEIWPELYAACRAASVSQVIVNGRLSERTLQRAHGWRAALYREALAGVRILARSEDDAEAYAQLGAERDAIEVVGNLKFASLGKTETRSSAALIAQPYVLAASTHADEDEALARAWLHGSDAQPTPLLVFVPRHPERGTALGDALQRLTQTKVTLRSREQQPKQTDRFHVADTLGELGHWYRHADAAFVGGSLGARGGQNMLESLDAGCPTIVGGNTRNFADVMALLEQHQAIDVAKDANAVADFLLAGKNGRHHHPARRRQQQGYATALGTIADVLARYCDRLGVSRQASTRH